MVVFKLPALSSAMTVKVLGPRVSVSMLVPFVTVPVPMPMPVQMAMPDRESMHL